MGYPQSASSNPPNPDVQYKGTMRISPMTFLFFFHFMSKENHRLSTIHRAVPKPLSFIQSENPSPTKQPFFFLLPKTQQSIVSKRMPNNGKRWQSQPSRVNPKGNKLSIDANHHQSSASLQCGITQCMQLIFNRYPSIIQLNGIARHPT